jgi:hypothetical protein
MSYQDYPPPPNYGQWGPPPQQNSGNATAALVLGICGMFLCPIVCSILAIVFAGKAYQEIDYSGGRLGGRGMAQAGKILGWIGLALWGLGIIAYVALFVIVLAIGSSLDNGDFDTISLGVQLLGR